MLFDFFPLKIMDKKQKLSGLFLLIFLKERRVLLFNLKGWELLVLDIAYS